MDYLMKVLYEEDKKKYEELKVEFSSTEKKEF